MSQTVRIRNKAANTAPPVLTTGEMAVELSTYTRLWVGTGTANRLLLSNNNADIPLGTGAYLKLAGGTMTGSINMNTVSGLGIRYRAPATLVHGPWGENAMALGWDAGRLRVRVDATDVGFITLNTNLGNYVLKVGDTMSGALTISTIGAVNSYLNLKSAAAQSYLYFDRISGKEAGIWGRTGLLPRWKLQLGNGTPETTVDLVGSNVELHRYNNAGAVVDRVLNIPRSTGIVDFGKTPTVAGVAIAVGAHPAASNAVPLMDGTAAAGTAAAYARGDHRHPTDTSRVADTGDTMTGVLVIQTAAAVNAHIRMNQTGTGDSYVYLDRTSGQEGAIIGRTGGLMRWQLTMANSTLETATDLIGSDWALARYNNVGTVIDWPLTCMRNTGIFNFKFSPTAPTPAVGDDSFKLATTAFVKDQNYAVGAHPAASNAVPLMSGTAAAGTAATYARGDHRHPTDTTRAPLNAPVFTGDARAVTPPAADSDTSIATTAWVTAKGYATTGALGSYVLKAGDTMSGALTVNATLSTDKIEVGRAATAGTPYIDFRSAGLSTDYDVRLLATGGNATAGNGTLTLTGTFVVSKSATVSTTTANAWAMVTSTAAQSFIYLDRASTHEAGIWGRTGTLPRWKLQLGNGAAETTVDWVGSNVQLHRYNNAGGGVALVLDIARSTGIVNFAQTPTVAGVAIAVGVIPTGANSVPLMDGTGAAGTGTFWARGDHRHPTDTSRAPLNAPVFTGDARAVTPATGDNDTSIATTAFVKAQGYATTGALGSYVRKIGDAMTGSIDMSGTAGIGVRYMAPASLVNGAWGANIIGLGWGGGGLRVRVDLTDVGTCAFLKSPVFIGNPTAPTPATADNDTSIATTAYVKANLGSYVLKAGDTMSGTLTGPSFRASVSTFPSTTGMGSTWQLIADATGIFQIFNSGCWDVYDKPSNNRGWYVNSTTMNMSVLGTGDFFIRNEGFKPSGGSWVASSDARIKKDVRPYTRGLAAIMALEPKIYSYIAATGYNPYIRYVGLIADDVEKVLPETVGRIEVGGMVFKGLEGIIKDGLKTFNASDVTWALVNAVKELASRLAALEATAR